jgi:hypothetical protein
MQPTKPPQSTVRDRLDIRARRISTIRRRVAASLLATFALAFGAIWHTGSVGGAPTAAMPSAAGATSVASSTPVSAPATAPAAVTTSQS